APRPSARRRGRCLLLCYRARRQIYSALSRPSILSACASHVVVAETYLARLIEAPPMGSPLGERPEEARRLPHRPRGVIRHAIGQQVQQVTKFGRSFPIDRLVDVVRWLVIPRVHPRVESLLIR